jgi:hypothetical protein
MNGSGRGRTAVHRRSQRVRRRVDVIDDHVPDAPCIGTEICVDDPVAGPGNRPPRMSGCAALNAALMFLAASPITAMEQRTDLTIIGLATNAAKSMPAVSVRISVTAEIEIMSSTHSLSPRGIGRSAPCHARRLLAPGRGSCRPRRGRPGAVGRLPETGGFLPCGPGRTSGRPRFPTRHPRHGRGDRRRVRRTQTPPGDTRHGGEAPVPPPRSAAGRRQECWSPWC